MNESPDASWKSFDDFVEVTQRDLPIQDSDRWVSYHLEDLYPEWQLKAHCAGVGLDNYFGNEQEQPTMSFKQIRQASKLCDVCPVYRECLNHALSNKEEYGVWAGTSGRVRRKIFTMIDQGQVTVDQVVEDFACGRRESYTGPLGGSASGNPRRVSPEQGRGSLPDEVAL